MPTFDAAVARLEIGHQVLGTGLQVVQLGVRHSNVTRLSTRAPPVDDSEYIRIAADVIVAGHTAALLHTPVLRCQHHNHVTRWAGGVEDLWETVLSGRQRTQRSCLSRSCSQWNVLQPCHMTNDSESGYLKIRLRV